jgi:hypothetical protein
MNRNLQGVYTEDGEFHLLILETQQDTEELDMELDGKMPHVREFKALSGKIIRSDLILRKVDRKEVN